MAINLMNLGIYRRIRHAPMLVLATGMLATLGIRSCLPFAGMGQERQRKLRQWKEHRALLLRGGGGGDGRALGVRFRVSVRRAVPVCPWRQPAEKVSQVTRQRHGYLHPPPAPGVSKAQAVGVQEVAPQPVYPSVATVCGLRAIKFVTHDRSAAHLQVATYLVCASTLGQGCRHQAEPGSCAGSQQPKLRARRPACRGVSWACHGRSVT